jgi:hypothetical protein
MSTGVTWNLLRFQTFATCSEQAHKSQRFAALKLPIQPYQSIISSNFLKHNNLASIKGISPTFNQNYLYIRQFLILKLPKSPVGGLS